MQHWLLKSEPGDYSIDDLARDRRDWWTGVRNYQARNFMKEMKTGDGALFYHSSCPEPGVYGVAKVCAVCAPDPTQFDSDSKYYDAKSSPDNPRWVCPQIAFVRKLKHPLLLPVMRGMPALAGMRLLQRGNRLSVLPVSAKEWKCIVGK